MVHRIMLKIFMVSLAVIFNPALCLSQNPDVGIKSRIDLANISTANIEVVALPYRQDNLNLDDETQKTIINIFQEAVLGFKGISHVSIRYLEGWKFIIGGESESRPRIFKFVSALDESQAFENVRLIKTVMIEAQLKSATRFEISFRPTENIVKENLFEGTMEDLKNVFKKNDLYAEVKPDKSLISAQNSDQLDLGPAPTAAESEENYKKDLLEMRNKYSLVERLSHKLNLDVQQISVSDILSFLAYKAGLDVEIEENFDKVDVNILQISIKAAIDQICQSQQLKCAINNETLVVSPK